MNREYGEVIPAPDAAVLPDKNLDYRIVYSVMKDAEDVPDWNQDLNPGLFRIAKMIRIFEEGGLERKDLTMVVVLAGAAARVALKNEPYRELFGRDNPDLELIDHLKQSGVTLHVCGQMLGFKGYEREWVNPAVSVVLGNAVALITYQLRGYAFIST